MISFYRIKGFCHWCIVVDVTVILDIGHHQGQIKFDNISENVVLCKGYKDEVLHPHFPHEGRDPFSKRWCLFLFKA
jgi:Uncharacterized conserved protein